MNSREGLSFKLMTKSNVNPKEILDRKLKVEAAQTAEGRTSLYNPLLQKPVSLEPVGPGSYPNGLGGYAYIGPPPDFGGSYGCYEDASGRRQYGIKSSKQFSIYDGSPIALKAELSAEERQALLSQMDEVCEESKCESCRAELAISAAIKAEKVHCPYCSSEMVSAVEKIKTCYSKIEEMNMSKQQVKAEADLAKEAMKVETPKEANEAVDAPKAAQPEDHKEADKAASVIKEADCGLEAQPTAAAAEKEKIEASAKRKARLEAAKKAFDEKKKARALAALKNRKEVRAGVNLKKRDELKRELRIMATFNPAKFANIKKNPRLAEICAEVESKLYTAEERAQARAELKVMAEQDPAAAEQARKELEFIAPEILMENQEEVKKEEAPVQEAEAAKKDDAPAVEEAPKEEKQAEAAKADDDKADDKKDKEAEASAKEDDKDKEADASAKKDIEEEVKTESMKTEFLASISTLKGDDIAMTLHASEGENPFWNVMVDAEPVGRIYLQDQDNHEQIRAGFTANNYAENLAQAMQQVGVEKMLTMTKARLFSHRQDNTESMARVKAQALVEAKAEFAEKIQTLRQDFVKAVQTAVAASDKNLYQSNEESHALKGGLYNALASIDMNHQAAVWAIEAGFEAAPEYFDFITQKAIEIMDMPTEARASFEKIVSSSGKMELAAGAKPEEESLRDRLVKSSTIAIASGGFVGGEDKELVRANLNLSANRR